MTAPLIPAGQFFVWENLVIANQPAGWCGNPFS